MYRGKVGMLFDALFDMEERSIAFSEYSYKHNDMKPTNYSLMRGENSAYEYVLLPPETKEQRTVSSSTYVVVLLHRCYKLVTKHFVYIRLLVFIWSSRR